MATLFGDQDIFDIIAGGAQNKLKGQNQKMLDEIEQARAANEQERAANPQPETAGQAFWKLGDHPVLGGAAQEDPDVLNMMGYPTTGQQASVPVPTGQENTLEKTPDQARANPKKSADADIVKNAVENVDKKAKGFNLDEVIAAHKGEDTGGGYITRKAIKDPGQYGLVDKGYVAVKGDEGSSEKGGDTYYIYGKKEDKKGSGAAAGKEISTGNKDEDFYQKAAAQVSQLHGIPDVRTFNPYTETARIVNQQKGQYFRYIFGSKASSPEQLNPEQRKYWEAQVKELEGHVFNEVKTRYELAVNDLKGVMDRYEKSKDKFGTAREGSIIWDKNTGKIVSQMPGKDTTKRLPEGVAKDVEAYIASFFKPVALQGQVGFDTKTEDIFHNLDRRHQDLYNEIRDAAYKLIEENPRLAGPQAVGQVLRQGGLRVEQEASTDKNKPGIIKVTGGKGGNTPIPTTRQEAMSALKQRYPAATDAQLDGFITRKFPNLK